MRNRASLQTDTRFESHVLFFKDGEAFAFGTQPVQAGAILLLGFERSAVRGSALTQG